MKRPSRSIASILPAFVLAALLAAGCPKPGSEPAPAGSPPAGAPAAPPAVPAVVGQVERMDFPVIVEGIGSVEAYSTVYVKAQVGGELSKVHFAEGQDISKGDMLFTLDSRPFQTALKVAQARFERDQAELKQAEVDFGRYQTLIRQKAAAQEQLDAAQTKMATMQATIRADQADIEMAKLSLDYCSIRSPINGRTGGLMVHEGNLVKANADSAMVTLYQVEPIHVAFSVPEQLLAEIRRMQAESPLKISVAIQGDAGAPSEGKLTFIDAQVDGVTGTIRLKGAFPNSDRRLWPGQFVNVKMTLRTIKDAVVAPTRAIQMSQRGLYAFVVGADKSVEMRSVVAGFALGEKTVIEKGLAAGETVVTDGHLRLFPGARVEIKSSEDQGTTVKQDAKP